MIHALHHRSLWSLDTLSRGDMLDLLETAAALKRSDAAGRPQRPLRGRNLAVLCGPVAGPAPSEFEHAARELGANVAQVRSDEPRNDGTSPTARLLGRLYDAIDCEGVDAATVLEIDREAGVPVFNGLSADTHPTCVLAVLLTLESRSSRPVSALRVAYVGDVNTPNGDALVRAAALTGMELRVAAPAGRPESAEIAASGADFVLGEDYIVRSVTESDRRFALQAVLLSALA